MALTDLREINNVGSMLTGGGEVISGGSSAESKGDSSGVCRNVLKIRMKFRDGNI